MNDATPRPPNGYALSLYDDLRRDVRDLRVEITQHRQRIAGHSANLMTARWALVQAERTLAWMQEHQADEIAELEAARARVRAILKGALKGAHRRDRTGAAR